MRTKKYPSLQAEMIVADLVKFVETQYDKHHRRFGTFTLEDVYSNPAYDNDKTQRRFKILAPSLNTGVTDSKYPKMVQGHTNNLACDPRLLPPQVTWDKQMVVNCTLGTILHDLGQLYTQGYLSKSVSDSIWYRISSENPDTCAPIMMML